VKYFRVNIWNAIWHLSFVGYSFATVGVFSTAIELTEFFWKDAKWIDEVRPYWWVILIFAILFGIYKNWPKSKIIKQITNTDIKISIIRGDIFASKNPLIVGVSTTFDTNIEDNTISPSSIQGQYTSKYFSDLPTLKSLISDQCSTLQNSIKIDQSEKPYGPRVKFIQGDAIFINNQDRKAYFVPIAHLNFYKSAKLSPEEFVLALPRMWVNIRERGEFLPIDIPLLGAGHARLNMNRKEILVEIISSFVAASRENRFIDCLNIYISQSDFSQGEFDFIWIEKMLESKCGLFSNKSILGQSDNIGKAIS